MKLCMCAPAMCSAKQSRGQRKGIKFNEKKKKGKTNGNDEHLYKTHRPENIWIYRHMHESNSGCWFVCRNIHTTGLENGIKLLNGAETERKRKDK